MRASTRGVEAEGRRGDCMRKCIWEARLQTPASVRLRARRHANTCAIAFKFHVQRAELTLHHGLCVGAWPRWYAYVRLGLSLGLCLGLALRLRPRRCGRRCLKPSARSLGEQLLRVACESVCRDGARDSEGASDGSALAKKCQWMSCARRCKLGCHMKGAAQDDDPVGR